MRSSSLAAAETAPRYPRPDLSDYVPCVTRQSTAEHLDLGWLEGVLSDGRLYRADLWSQNRHTFLSVCFSADGIPQLSVATARELLSRERIVELTVLAPAGGCGALKTWDASGNVLWSVNLLLANECAVFARALGTFQPMVALRVVECSSTVPNDDRDATT